MEDNQTYYFMYMHFEGGITFLPLLPAPEVSHTCMIAVPNSPLKFEECKISHFTLMAPVLMFLLTGSHFENKHLPHVMTEDDDECECE